MTRTYWLNRPRRFQNEYVVGVATSATSALQYHAEGFSRIDRPQALRMMSRRPENGEQIYIDVSIDGQSTYDRFETAREIRA